MLMQEKIVVLACEHLKRRPLYWKERLRGRDPS